MRNHIKEQPLGGQPYHYTEYKVLQVPASAQSFAEDIAAFFIRSWMKNAHVDMMQIWQNWATSSEEDKNIFHSYLAPALMTGNDLVDDPSSGVGRTGPIGTFCETMLRAIRADFSGDQILVHPPLPAPPGDGNIDLLEVTGKVSDASSLRVTLWEIKGSDGQAHGHNSKIYEQLRDYPKRLFPIANLMGEYYSGDDPGVKLFLRNMALLARNRSPQVHYGAFIVYDENIPQEGNLVPGLCKVPLNHPTPADNKCHHLAVLLIPDFRKLRFEVWRTLKFVPKP